MSDSANKSVLTSMETYHILWTDANIDNPENQKYIKGFKDMNFVNVEQFKSVEDLCIKIDLRRTRSTIILLTSGSLSDQISKEM
jgi:hypothetical protein